MERSGEDSKAFDPSIVKFSYKFLLDVIQRPHPAVHKAGRVVGEGVSRKGWKERERNWGRVNFASPTFLSPPPSSLSTAVLLILHRLTIHAGEKLVLLVFFSWTSSFSFHFVPFLFHEKFGFGSAKKLLRKKFFITIRGYWITVVSVQVVIKKFEKIARLYRNLV